MKNLSHPGKSTRLRLSALVCLFLLLGASTAEVAHHHPGDLDAQQTSLQSSRQHAPAQNQNQNQKENEARCPLCIAMHAVLPVAAHVVIAPVAFEHEVFLAASSFHYTSRWSFELFSRPPPALATA